MKQTIVIGLGLMTCVAVAQDARATYQMQQAIAEVPRLAQQFDQLQTAQDALSIRMSRLENGVRSGGDTQAEIAAVRAQVDQLRRDMNSMREQIVAEISRKMAALMARQNVSHETSGRKVRAETTQNSETPTGPYYEHIVESGQTLSEIAKGYGTTLAKVLAANPGIKPAALKVGQKVIVPQEPQNK